MTRKQVFALINAERQKQIKREGLIRSVQRGRRISNAYLVLALRDSPEQDRRRLLAAAGFGDLSGLTTVPCQDGHRAAEERKEGAQCEGRYSRSASCGGTGGRCAD